MSTAPSPYFFISYSREDTAKQRRIVKELRERGINLWVDIENLTPGTPIWEREIEKAIRGATGIIVLLSPESNNSEWVRRELSFGEQHRKRIFPVLIEGDDHASTPLRLASHQRVDLRVKFEAGLDELAGAVKEYIGVKQEIATQSMRIPRQNAPAKPAFDFKKYQIPALIGVIALCGLIVVGGAVSALINLGDARPTSTVEAEPTPGASDVTQAATEAVVPADEPVGRILFTCEIQGSEVCIMNADGSNWRRLTDTDLASSNASFAPDGKTAVYIVNFGDYTEIYELDIASGKTKPLTDLKQGLGAPDISPDGGTILFNYAAKNGNVQIWSMRRDGSDPQEFYSQPGKDVHDGAWSPDGSQIVFALGKGENNKLYIMDVEARDPQVINDDIDTRGRSDWSIFNLVATDQGGPFAHDVYTVNLDGSNLTKLTSGTNAQGVSFSPDGKWIAFTAYTNVAGKDQASCEIFIMRVDGSDVRRLTDNNYCDFQPRWGG